MWYLIDPKGDYESCSMTHKDYYMVVEKFLSRKDFPLRFRSSTMINIVHEILEAVDEMENMRLLRRGIMGNWWEEVKSRFRLLASNEVFRHRSINYTPFSILKYLARNDLLQSSCMNHFYEFQKYMDKFECRDQYFSDDKVCTISSIVNTRSYVNLNL